MRMTLSLFHDQSVSMGEMADCFFLSRKLLLHSSAQLFSASFYQAQTLPPARLSCTPTTFFVHFSHLHTFIAFPVPLKLEHPQS